MVESSIKNISKILDHPEQTTEEELSYLFNLSMKNSYSGFCFLLIAKVLKAQNRTGFNNIIKSAALRSNNRKQLQNIINTSKKEESSDLIKENQTKNELKTNHEEISNEEAIIERNIYNNIISNELINEIEELPKQQEDLTKKADNINSDTKFTFERWLYKSQHVEKSKKERTLDDILNSIENRKTNNNKNHFFSAEETAKKSLIENEDMNTETLAEIYVKQGNYPKAVKIYEQLMLSNPEKKLFFASRINFINKKTQK